MKVKLEKCDLPVCLKCPSIPISLFLPSHLSLPLFFYRPLSFSISPPLSLCIPPPNLTAFLLFRLDNRIGSLWQNSKDGNNGSVWFEGLSRCGAQRFISQMLWQLSCPFFCNSSFLTSPWITQGCFMNAHYKWNINSERKRGNCFRQPLTYFCL